MKIEKNKNDTEPSMTSTENTTSTVGEDGSKKNENPATGSVSTVAPASTASNLSGRSEKNKTPATESVSTVASASKSEPAIGNGSSSVKSRKPDKKSVPAPDSVTVAHSVDVTKFKSENPQHPASLVSRGSSSGGSTSGTSSSGSNIRKTRPLVPSEVATETKGMGKLKPDSIDSDEELENKASLNQSREDPSLNSGSSISKEKSLVSTKEKNMEELRTESAKDPSKNAGGSSVSKTKSLTTSKGQKS